MCPPLREVPAAKAGFAPSATNSRNQAVRIQSVMTVRQEKLAARIDISGQSGQKQEVWETLNRLAGSFNIEMHYFLAHKTR